MNRENFPDFLKNAEKLSQLTYEELKTLSLQYPYCANLHLLLWEKSRQDEHPDEEKNLAKAAAYTFDRAHLFRLYHAGETLAVETIATDHQEEVLELKELSFLEPVPIPVRQEVQRPFGESDLAETPAANMTVDDELTEGEEEHVIPEAENGYSEIPSAASSPEVAIEPEPSKDTEQEIPPLSADLLAEVVETVSAGIGSLAIASGGIQEIIQDDEGQDEAAAEELSYEESVPPDMPSGAREIIFEIAGIPGADATPDPEQEQVSADEDDLPPPAPMPKNRFSSWRNQHAARPAFVIPEIPIEENVPAEHDVKYLAEQSLADNEGIVSETLANLLVNQGQNEKAIKMFERLMHKNPEKSAYFAAKIEELKKN